MKTFKSIKFLCFITMLFLAVGCGETTSENGQSEKKETDKEQDKETVSKYDVPNPDLGKPVADYTKWEIKNGKFYFDGKWKFLKTAKPLVNFSDATAVDKLISSLDILRSKYYTSIELNCYWHHFDLDGDGI